MASRGTDAESSLAWETWASSAIAERKADKWVYK